MTGFNHYSNCGCGWCVSSDRRRYGIKDFRGDFLRRDAALRLEKRGVNSVAGCYVVPNARCPVCSASVFFYANRFGSRVYFDDLGPPWPKHPCTDNTKFRTGPAVEAGKILPRPSGEAREILADARLVGKSPEKNSWKLMRVLASYARGGVFNVDLCSQEPDNEAKFLFEFGEPWLPAEGDLVHAGDKEVIYFDIEAMSPRTLAFKRRTRTSDRDASHGLHEIVAGWIARGETNPERIADALNRARALTPSGGRWSARAVQREFFGMLLVKPVGVEVSKAKSSRKRQKSRRRRKRDMIGRAKPVANPQ